MNPARVILQARRARPFFARHPWVFAQSIARIEDAAGEPVEPEPGAEVALYSHEGAFIARGLFNPRSLIRVRLYRWEDEPLDEPFWAGRIDAALSLRRDILRLDAPGRACRLIYSEADGLSGLTVDRYDRWLVAQFTSLALFSRRDLLVRLLAERTGAEGIALRTERGVAGLEGLDPALPDEPAFGTLPAGSVEILEHDIRYVVDLRDGQKTGFFLDQRDNRRAVAAYAGGRRALDLFCYTGGFALSVLKHGGATHALGIDSSALAIELARQNAVNNHLPHARFEKAEIGAALARLRDGGERFGLIVCDPPKFARSPRALESALNSYARLNRAVLDVLEPGGILATCSCSGHVDRPVFAEMLAGVAESAGRPIQILEQRGQAPDHPVATSCLETEYLKCFVCRVG